MRATDGKMFTPTCTIMNRATRFWERKREIWMYANVLSQRRLLPLYLRTGASSWRARLRELSDG